MTKLEFVLDKQSDALNWYDSANGSNFGVDWSKSMPTPILDKIKNKSKEEALDALSPILDKRYEINALEKVVHDLNIWREKNGQEAFNRMESIVGKPIPVDTIEAKITTTGRCPYNSHKWFFMYSPFKQGAIKNPEDSIGISMHELLHMMLHYYYEDYIKQQGLTHEEFHDMKEAQTIILNEAYADILTIPDSGYEMHTDIRSKFAEFWKGNKNFDAFVDYGIQVMLERRESKENIIKDITVIPASENEAERCCKLTEETMKSYHNRYPDSYEKEWFLQKFIEGLNDTHIIKIGEKNVGYVEYGEQSSSDTTLPSYFLSELHISPQYQGLGIGGKILAYIDSQIGKKAESISLLVYKDNPAVKLYERHGYKIERESKDPNMRLMKKEVLDNTTTHHT